MFCWRTVYCLLSLFLCVYSASVTITAQDPSLSLTSGWQSSSTSGEISLFTVDLGAALGLVLPPVVTSVIYVALKRTNGSEYAVCLDCHTPNSVVSSFDGHDDSLLDDSDAKPTTIFTLQVDPSCQHTLIIENQPDVRFGGQSEITFTKLIVQTENDTSTSNSSMSTLPPGTTQSRTLSFGHELPPFVVSSGGPSIITTTVEVPLTSPSSNISSSASSSTSAVTNQVSGTFTLHSSLIIAITVLSVVALLSILLGFCLFRQVYNGRRRKTNCSPFSGLMTAGEPSSEPSADTLIVSKANAKDQAAARSQSLDLEKGLTSGPSKFPMSTPTVGSPIGADPIVSLNAASGTGALDASPQPPATKADRPTTPSSLITRDAWITRKVKVSVT